MKLKVLFVTAELDPLIKVGGLGDVSGGLPCALRAQGHDVRVLLPGYGGLRGVSLDDLPIAVRLPTPGHCMRELVEDEDHPPVWLLDTPEFREREHPYQKRDGSGWNNDAEVYAHLARVAAWLAGDAAGLDWRADVVHANEWHTALVPVELLLRRVPVASVFTIHNLAYQGIFPLTTAQRLGFPNWLLQPAALEFHGGVSFMKGGIIFADHVTAVSPGYAEEICTPEFGERLDGLLRSRRTALTGVLNGIDTARWNPATDDSLQYRYSIDDMEGKRAAKRALLDELGLPANTNDALLVFVGRLVGQKGIDLLIGALPELLKQPVRIAVLGSGDRLLEAALRATAARHPERFAVHIGYNEALSRRFFAGGDILLMPSRFEPCGLTQMYAMRYGCLPVAHAVGGLRDSITDASASRANKNNSTGFLFRNATVDALLEAITRALGIRRSKKRWMTMVRTAMREDFGWEASAQRYVSVYGRARSEREIFSEDTAGRPVS